MTEITLDAARVALRDVVAEFGENYVYAKQEVSPSHIDPDGPAGGSCFYVHDSDNGSVPGCLIAQVLYRHFDWSVDDLKDIEGRSAYDIPGLLPKVRNYFSEAQTCQDASQTWGESLKQAETYAKEVEL